MEWMETNSAPILKVSLVPSHRPDSDSHQCLWYSHFSFFSSIPDLAASIFVRNSTRHRNMTGFILLAVNAASTFLSVSHVLDVIDCSIGSVGWIFGNPDLCIRLVAGLTICGNIQIFTKCHRVYHISFPRLSLRWKNNHPPR